MKQPQIGITIISTKRGLDDLSAFARKHGDIGALQGAAGAGGQAQRVAAALPCEEQHACRLRGFFNCCYDDYDDEKLSGLL